MIRIILIVILLIVVVRMVLYSRMARKQRVSTWDPGPAFKLTGSKAFRKSLQGYTGNNKKGKKRVIF